MLALHPVGGADNKTDWSLHHCEVSKLRRDKVIYPSGATGSDDSQSDRGRLRAIAVGAKAHGGTKCLSRSTSGLNETEDSSGSGLAV